MFLSTDILNQVSDISIEEGPIRDRSLLLDVNRGAAVAYSVRKLSLVYAGPALRVRRSSDNAEMDIGFSGLHLDTATLLSFTGTGSAFVTTWYDQSGNGNDASQAMASSQPQIVNGGVLINQNSNPTIRFDGIDDVLDISNSLGITGSISRTIISVLKPNNNNITNYFLNIGDGSGVTTNPSYDYNLTPEFGLRVQGGNAVYGNATTEQCLINSILVSNNVLSNEFYLNNEKLTPISSSDSIIDTRNNVQNIGGAVTGSSTFFSGNIQSIIIYTLDKTDSINVINKNINAYFNIY